MATKKTSDAVRQRVITSMCTAMAARMIARRPPFAVSRRTPFWLGGPRARSAKAIGTYAIGSFLIGGLALGTFAVGNFVVGRLGIGRLRLRDGRIKKLRIDELEIGRLRVLEQQPAESPNGVKAAPVPEIAPV